MDGFGGPARPALPQRPQEPARQAAPPAPTRLQQPQPARQQRPVDARPAAYQQAQAQTQAAPAKKGGGWKVALQFVIGLLVIAGVAAAIVYLYIKYYQQ